MRVRVLCDASAGSTRFLVRVPKDLELVADLVRHLHLRLPETDLASSVLRVGGFALLPTLRLADVVRDDDEVTVSAGSEERPKLPPALPDTEVTPQKKRKLPEGSEAAKDQTDAPAKARALPPFPPPPAAAATDAKKPKEAAAPARKAMPGPKNRVSC